MGRHPRAARARLPWRDRRRPDKCVRRGMANAQLSPPKGTAARRSRPPAPGNRHSASVAPERKARRESRACAGKPRPSPLKQAAWDRTGPTDGHIAVVTKPTIRLPSTPSIFGKSSTTMEGGMNTTAVAGVGTKQKKKKKSGRARAGGFTDRKALEEAVTAWRRANVGWSSAGRGQGDVGIAALFSVTDRRTQ